MNGIFLLLLFSSSVTVALAASDVLKRRHELRPLPVVDEEVMERVFFSEAIEQHQKLKSVKYHMVNGNIATAKSLLRDLRYQQTRLLPVIDRYAAMIAFIEGDFEKSLDFVSRPHLQTIPQYSHICVLKVLNQIILAKTKTLEDDWSRCRLENVDDMNAPNVTWLDTLVQLRLRPIKGVTRIPFQSVRLAALQTRDLKILLKLALYLNQEPLLAEQLPDITVEQLRDPEVRELVGQLHFRQGSLVNAYRFVGDLQTPNSENIKGNLYIMREKFELAYAQFKLALKQKVNSQNAMERLLPLAWLLGDWEGGVTYAKMTIPSPRTHVNKLTILAAFLMQKGDYKQSKEVLKTVRQNSRRGSEAEVNQIYSFTSLMENDPAQVITQAGYSCRQNDLPNCWLLYQMKQWDSFPLTIRRDDNIPHKEIWRELAQAPIDEPLKEKIFVNQLDIEELDDRLIQLIPKTP